MSDAQPGFVHVAALADLESRGCMVVQAGGRPIGLFLHEGKVYALDNRCPHMGFPMDQGSVADGILTCHWHHARFDLESGGTFDPWADDLPAFPVELRDEEIWLDLSQPDPDAEYHRMRLREGLEQDIPLVIAKSAIALQALGDDPAKALRIGLRFGTRNRRGGWGQGLTILTCMHNLLPALRTEDRSRALYHGLSAVARDSAGMPPRFNQRPLPGETADLPSLKRWFRRFIEVRDEDGAERCILSALAAAAEPRQMADMLFAAATDHRYLSTGHVLDFTNKALEALDSAGWDLAEPVLTSLVHAYATGLRSEEVNAWRHPIDLVAILDSAFESLPEALAQGARGDQAWQPNASFIDLLLADDPQAIADALLDALRHGAEPVLLASTVSQAAALRIARFPTTNEFADWDTALHSFSFACAVQRGLERAPSPELLRGVFDAAMSVYLDRFLNTPEAALPRPTAANGSDAACGPLELLLDGLDRQQSVRDSAQRVVDHLAGGDDAATLIATLGQGLLREDRDFHTIQCLEAALRRHADHPGTGRGMQALVAAARYLAAHAPTARAQGQTFEIAWRLHRGEAMSESSPEPA